MKYDVCVFGGCSISRNFYQKQDGTYNRVPDIIAPGGKGANQAVAAARAGAKVTIITRIGKDSIGKNIYNNLINNGIDTSNVELIDGLNNDHTNIYVNANDKTNKMKHYIGATNSFTPDMIINHQDVILNSTIIVCQLKCPMEVTEALISFCNQHQKFLILTPCRPKKLIGKLDLLDKVNLITCNEEECQTMFQTDNVDSCVVKYPNKLIVTLGKNGLIFYNGKEIIRMPAIDVPVIDTTGAGDTLNGNLANLISKEWSLEKALERAQYAAAMKIQVKSAQAGMPTKEELDKFMAN